MQTASKKVINGWAMYDWANSVYNLVGTLDELFGLTGELWL